MRMWQVPPEVLCDKHLLGEHVEMHMFAGTLIKGKSLEGYITNRLVDTDLISERHDQLAKEMSRRGMNHKSPIQKFPAYRKTVRSVDSAENLVELKRRCKACANRIITLEN